MGETAVNDQSFGQPRVSQAAEHHSTIQGLNDYIQSHFSLPDRNCTEANGKNPAIAPGSFENFADEFWKGLEGCRPEALGKYSAPGLDDTLARYIYSQWKSLSTSDKQQQATHAVADSSKAPALSLRLPGGEVLSLSGSKQGLDTTDGSHLTVENGAWSLKDKSGNEVHELPQDTKELRMPQWYDLSNGGTVTYDRGQTILSYHGNTVTFNQKGISSIECNSKVERLR